MSRWAYVRKTLVPPGTYYLHVGSRVVEELRPDGVSVAAEEGGGEEGHQAVDAEHEAVLLRKWFWFCGKWLFSLCLHFFPPLLECIPLARLREGRRAAGGTLGGPKRCWLQRDGTRKVFL